MKKLQFFLLYWLPVITWAFVIFWFSSLPSVHTSKVYWQDFIIKKVAHITEYGILAILCYRGLINSGIKRNKTIKSTILLTFIYAITDEFHQKFTPGREPAIRDVIFDLTGSSLSLFMIAKYIQRVPLAWKAWTRKLGLV